MSKTKRKSISSRAKSKSDRVKPLRFTDEHVFGRNTMLISRRQADRSVALMKLDDVDKFYRLDGIAADLWLLIDGKKALRDIKEKLIKSHRPPLEQFRRDVQMLVVDLLKHGLITSL